MAGVSRYALLTLLFSSSANYCYWGYFLCLGMQRDNVPLSDALAIVCHLILNSMAPCRGLLYMGVML